MREDLFRHVSRADLWSRCDCDGLRIDPETECLRLATVEASSRGPQLTASDFDALRARFGGALPVPCAPDACTRSVAVLADPANPALLALGPEGWRSLATVPEARPGGFVPRPAAPAPNTIPAALQRDAEGRLWLLERGPGRLAVLDPDGLGVLATIDLPMGATADALAVHAEGVTIADGTNGRLWHRPLAGDWQEIPAVEIDFAPGTNPLDGHRAVSGSGHPAGMGYILFRPLLAAESRLLILGVKSRAVVLDGLADPLFLLALADGVLIGEATPVAGHDRLQLLRRYRTQSDGGLGFVETLGVRGFDGRAIWEDTAGCLWASTAAGTRQLKPRPVPIVPAGLVETYALDSGRVGCRWGRVFLDACLPSGTALTGEIKTSDHLPHDALRRAPRPPLDSLPAPVLSEPAAVTQAWAALPLGSERPDETEGWVPLGPLDRRGALADRPFHDEHRQPPSEDRLPRGAAPSAVPAETLEGLVKAPPGRYLWLRVTLTGHRTASPALRALRVSFARPSLLDRLPAYWRADAAAADPTDRALALFESFDTELHAKISALPLLLDPANCPAEGLNWLAGFLGLVFDTRLGEPVRRQLLLEAAWLYRMRGTVPALERLCAILARAEVQVIEGFRMRASGGSELSNQRLGSGGILGDSLRLGTGGGAVAEDWEAALRVAAAELAARRDADPAPCPPEDPEPPLDDRAPVPTYRRYAHRFTVVVMRACEGSLGEILDTAVEINKPAHTLHLFCFLEAGFRLGVTTYAGLSTRFGRPEGFTPGCLGRSEIGGDHTIGAPPVAARIAPGFFVGKSTVTDRGGACARFPRPEIGGRPCP